MNLTIQMISYIYSTLKNIFWKNKHTEKSNKLTNWLNKQNKGPNNQLQLPFSYNPDDGGLQIMYMWENVIISEFWLVEFSYSLAKMSGNYAEKCSYFLERVFRGEDIMSIIYFKMFQH